MGGIIFRLQADPRDSATERKVRKQLAKGVGILKVAKSLGIGSCLLAAGLDPILGLFRRRRGLPRSGYRQRLLRTDALHRILIARDPR
jgi:hypothetical protein